MNNNINNFIKKIDNFYLNEDDYIKNSLPEWLYEEFYYTYTIDTRKVCESMFKEASFDIRLKKGISRTNIINKFKEYNIESDATPISPIGIRLTKRNSINHLKEFKDGLLEVQDEGSQIVSLLCGAKENEIIIDLYSKYISIIFLIDISTDFSSICYDFVSTRTIEYRAPVEAKH